MKTSLLLLLLLLISISAPAQSITLNSNQTAKVKLLADVENYYRTNAPPVIVVNPPVGTNAPVTVTNTLAKLTYQEWLSTNIDLMLDTKLERTSAEDEAKLLGKLRRLTPAQRENIRNIIKPE